MVIKKFVGKTEAAAIEAARKELGEGLVVMNVREIKKKGFFSLFTKKLIEVTAAIEDDSESLENIKKEIRNVAQTVEKAQLKVKKITNEDDGSGSADANTDNIEKKLDSLQSFLEQKLNNEKKAADNQKSGDKESGQREIKKEPLRENEIEGMNSEQEQFYKLLYNTMIENEMDEKYANMVMEEMERSSNPNVPFDYILSGVYQKLILKFGKSEGITLAERGPKAVFFVGPTGVGKTTTIAKVASSLSMYDKRKVALITTDTYRIAAAEQLHTYANILEIPFRVVYTENEMSKALSDFKDYEYILVDTTGHSHQSSDQLDKVKSFLDTAKDVVEYQVFLVLSATTKYKDLLDISGKYKKITDYQLIFTKLDETSSLGNLMNVKLKMDIPIAYVTYGQNVPDDIEIFDPQKTVKQLLGG